MLRSAPFWYRKFPRTMHALRRISRANYEPEMELLDVLCHRDRAGVDVGAKLGMYTYRILARSSRVIAFEPYAVLHRMLCKVFEGRPAQIEPYALSNKHGVATLRVPWEARGRGLWGRSTIEPANELAHEKIERTDEFEVETRTLDEYDLSDIGFIKIDVEGHELAVLEGAARTIAKDRPNLLVECNEEHCAGTQHEVASWLAEHEYRAYFMYEHALVPMTEFLPEHWRDHHIENFLCIHASRPEVVDAVASRI